MTACAHCPVGVLSSSAGYVHTDTHNTHGSDGHLAEPSAAFDQMMLDGVPDAWRPVDLPVEVTPDTGVVNAPYAPVAALAAIDARWGTPAHLTYVDPWEHMTRGQQDDHRETCDGCELCDTHRASCFGCGHDVDRDAEWCETCGEHWPTSRDSSDVKGSER